MFIPHEEKVQKTELLLLNIQRDLPQLEELLKDVTGDMWNKEDLLYRYYHQSFKVYDLQRITLEMYDALKNISPHLASPTPNSLSPTPNSLSPTPNSLSPTPNHSQRNFCEYFENIIKEGTEKKWIPEHNLRWEKECRPIIEAFFHAHYFLEMVVKYGKELQVGQEEVNNCLPSGWAAVLELYEIR
ncbi:hypothetical protein HYX13_00525 [Candidatus Woesearchaeota archaeon]|nr:hypothetical protein [Candidatus Woesearchaeota archaeon]